MKFRCERDVLADGLATAARAVSARAPKPVLAGIRFDLVGDRLELTGSDLDLTITVDLVVAGDTDGTIVIPAKYAVDIVKALGAGAVTFETDADMVRVSGGRSDFEVKLIPAVEEFPQFPRSSAESVTLNAHELAEGLRQVVCAASTDDSRAPVLTGVLMAAEGNGLRLVSTDSYRLAKRDLSGVTVLAEGEEVIVPSRALNELVRTLSTAEEVKVMVGEQNATFEVGSTRLTTQLIEGEFPNYRGLIPAVHHNRLTVGRDDLINAVRRVKLMAREATPVRLSMRDGSVDLVAITQDVGQAHEQVDAKYEGEPLEVAFNPDFLLTGLEVSPGDEITIDTVESSKPALLKSIDSDEFLYLLMPVRVS